MRRDDRRVPLVMRSSKFCSPTNPISLLKLDQSVSA